MSFKPLIVAGNGPSIKNLDYSLFPPDFDVFRCNQFYFEDKYYLGKEVKGVFFNSQVFDAQMRTARELSLRQEYYFEDLFCSTIAPFTYFGSNIYTHTQDYLDRHYPGARNTYDLLQSLEPFYKLHTIRRNFYQQHFTSGVMMIIVAIALGYKEIYCAGLDFYLEGLGHFYHAKSPHFTLSPDSQHTKDLDIKGIELAQQYAQLYALIPNSALSAILPLSPHKNALVQEKMQALKLGEFKPEGYIDDIRIDSPIIDLIPVDRPVHTSLILKVVWDVGITPDNIFYQSLRMAYHCVIDLYRIVRGSCKLTFKAFRVLKAWIKRHGSIGGGGGVICPFTTSSLTL
ncbi:alpha-2,3-sialyltransferase [Helicobacter cynogastricus]|uniref:alpha-2,3-sialyltransferase n=1 Tax=Helicobacter cynogastricus TaxID=329937 RepID=UPI000CF164A7|nr:alpha-2,3-sialyltransferase [Helicobacter cynogastricus]